MEKKSKKYYAVTYPDSDHPIYGIGMAPREAWEDFLPDACTSMHSKDQMRLGMPDELREMDSEEWERLGIENLVEMDVMRCSKALYDEVQKHGGNISYACDRNGMLVTEDEMQVEDERIESAERAAEDRIYVRAFQPTRPASLKHPTHTATERRGGYR